MLTLGCVTRFALAAVVSWAATGIGEDAAAGSSLTTLHAFAGADGKYSVPGLLFDTRAALYGATEYGGAGAGTVFELMPPAMTGGAWTAALLYSFKKGGSDGAFPVFGLVFDSFGALYGTTIQGGGRGDCVQGCGTVFKLTLPTTGGSWTETVLYKFASGSGGAKPSSGLVFDSFGALYGETEKGGVYGGGTVFELTPPATPGRSWTKNVTLQLP